MYLEQIHPFVRYIRYLEFNANEEHLIRIPYDARFFYVYKGESKIKIKDTVYTMERGDILIINSDIPYLFINEQPVCFIAINFDYTYKNFTRRFPIAPSYLGEDYDPESVLEKVTFKDAPALNTAFYAKAMFSLESKLTAMENIYNGKLMYYNNHLSSLMVNLLTQSLLNSNLPNPQSTSELKAPEQIIKYIHENYSKDISNKQIGETFNFHPNYVSSVIKNYTGMPLHGYILYVRISKAINLLDTTNYSVARIAEEVGFSSQSRFSNHFKKITGTSPTSYRHAVNA